MRNYDLLDANSRRYDRSRSLVQVGGRT